MHGVTGFLRCWCQWRGFRAVRSVSVDALLIGISGGSGSGKSRLAHELADTLGPDRVSILPFDAYYKDLRGFSMEERNAVNFDHPDSLDVEMYGHQLDGLVHGLDVALPVYDFTRHQRVDDLVILPSREIIIAEGILLFAFPELVERFDYKIFRRCSEDVRFSRRLERDMVERGRSEESITAQFASSVKPMHDRFVEPSASCADRIVDHTEDLTSVIAELAQEVHSIRV